MSRRKKLDLLLNLAWYAALGGIAAVCLQILLPRLAPLLLGLGLAVALHPAALWLCREVYAEDGALPPTDVAFRQSPPSPSSFYGPLRGVRL